MTLTFTEHALARCLDRDLAESVVLAVVERPVASGDAGKGARFACAPVLFGKRREWVSVIYEALPGGANVITVYRGEPVSANRLAAGRVR